MTAVIVQSGSGRIVLSNSIASTPPMDTTAGNTVLIAVGWLNPTFDMLSGVVDNGYGQQPVQDAAYQTNGGIAPYTEVRIYSRLVSVSRPGYFAEIDLVTNGLCCIAVMEVEGILTGMSCVQAVGAIGTSASTVSGVFPPDQIAFGAAIQSNETAWSINSEGWTQSQNTETGATACDIITGYKLVPDGFGQTFSVTDPGGDRIVALAMYKTTGPPLGELRHELFAQSSC